MGNPSQMYFQDRDFEGDQRYLSRQGAAPRGLPPQPLGADNYDGGDVTGTGHALPIPRTYIPDAPTPQPEPLPPSAGYGGMGAGIANVAANFMHGWLAGRDRANQRAAELANQKLSSSWAAYQMAMQMAQNPDLPEAQRTAAGAKLPGLKAVYLDQVRAMSGKPKAAKGEGSQSQGTMGKVEQGGKNVLGHLASMFMGRKPEAFQAGMADMLEKMLPDQAPPLSPRAQAARLGDLNAVGSAGIQAKQIQQASQVEDLRQQRDSLLPKLQDARQRGDKAAEADYSAQIRNIEERAQAGQQGAIVPGGLQAQQSQVGAVTSESDATRQRFAAQQAAFDAMSKGTDFWQLSPEQQIALGVSPAQTAEVQPYLRAVGQPGGFTSQREAIIAMQMDKASAMAKMYGMRTPLSQIEQRVRVEHPDWNEQQVAAQALNDYHKWAGTDIDGSGANGAGGGMKLDTPEHFAQARNMVAQQVMLTSPELKSLFKNVSADPKKQDWILDPQAKAATHWFWANETEPEFQKRRSEAIERLWVAGRGMNIPDAMLAKMFGPNPFGTTSPQASPTPGGQPAAPGAGAPAQGGAAASAPPSPQNPMQAYQVTDTSGKTQTVYMTPQEAQTMQQNPKYKGFQFKQGGAQPQQPQQGQPPAGTPTAQLQKPPFDMKYTEPIMPVKKPKPASKASASELAGMMQR